MYSELINVQILLSLLKKYSVKKMVLSSGTTSVPMIHSVEKDDFFECYSVVDERSAAYFAMGLSQESNEPVVLVCTSGTASCNYLPAITEAYYQNVPILVITCDKRPYELGQHILQKINQNNLFQDKCRFFAEIPYIKGDDSKRYCISKINEALIRCFIKERGPVHLNVYTGGNRNFTVRKLPKTRKIEYYNRFIEKDIKEICFELSNKKILIVAGQHGKYTQKEIEIVNKFADSYNCVVISDHMANLRINKSVFAYRAVESMTQNYFDENLAPDIVISFGGNILSGRFNDFLLHSNHLYENWTISTNGEMVDSWGHLRKWFEYDFMEYCPLYYEKSCNSYYLTWNEIVEKTPIPVPTKLSHLYIAKRMAEKIHEESIIHTGILNSTRVLNLYNLNNNITVYSNIGALGIDGSLSTFLGQAVATNKDCFLLIGDLSFFYDIGAINIRYLKGNMHIILVNNGGGGEFYYNIGKDAIPELDDYIAAAHTTKAQMWVIARGFKYYSAVNEEEFDDAFDDMLNSDYNVPQIIEVFTDKEFEANSIHNYYDDILHQTNTDEKKLKIKNVINKIVGEETTQKIVKRIKEK